MKVAFLFPGQGMETPRMGLHLARRDPDASTLLDQAAAVTGLDVTRLLSRGGHAIERTEVLQPVLTAVSLGALGALAARGCRPDYVAGHSLGEVSAWAAAGGITTTAAVDLAATRGRLMAQQAERSPGAMLALFGPRALVTEALDRARQQGDVAMAAHNAPEEWVLSGDRAALTSIRGRYPSRLLSVAGGWHGPPMSEAVAPLRQALVAADARPLQTPLLSNRTGEETPPGRSTEQFAEQLAEQLVHPVKWADVMSTLSRLGVTDYVTVGPGHVLRGLVRKNLGNRARVHTTEDPDDIARTLDQLLLPTEGPS